MTVADEPKWETIEAPPWATKPAEPKWEPIEAPAWATKKEERGGVSEALRPITTYPETQREMAKESLGQISRGVEQLKKPTGGDLLESAKAATKGVANVGLGTIGYVGSPITAAYRTVVGQPVQDVTGIPREYTEFAAQLATPGLGLPRMPGGAPTLTGAESRAARQLEKRASDVGAAKEKLATEPTEIVPGSRQTTFEMTGDEGLGAMERKARLRTPTPFVEQAETRAGARLQALEGAQPTGSVADVTEHLRRTRASEQRAIENDVALADQRAREAAELPGGGYDPETHGNVMRQELRNAEETTRAAEGAVWREVDPNGALRLDPMPLQQTERNIYGVMPEGGAAEASLTAQERQLTDIIQNYPARIPLQELRDFTSLLTSRMREELWTNGRSPAYARMSRLRQAVSDAEENVIGALGQRDTGLVERLREARTATRERAERFEAKPVGDVLQREGAQGPYKVQPAQVADKLIPQGNKGYDVASNYLRATGNESLGVYTEALTGKLRREVLRPDGTVDPRRLEGFVRRYDGVLRAINERDGGAFAQSLRDVGQTQERLANTTARQRAFTERWEDGELGKLVGATDNEHAINVVGNVFDRANSVPLARELATAVSGSPAAQAGLRRAVQQYVRRNYVGNTEAAGGTPLIQANKFQNFMKENEAALRQIMTPEQVDAWKAIATEMGRTTRIGQTKTLPGSDTAQNLASLGESWPWYAADTAVSFMATGIPTPIAHIAKPALKGLLAHMKKNGITSTSKLVDEAMLNPDVARKLLTMEKKTSLLRRVPGAVARTGALSGSSLSAEQQQAPRQAGGGVPAIGGTGGRSPGAGETSRAGAARQGAGQALQDGGAAGDQEADPSYETKLTPGEEHVFQGWKQKYAPNDSGEDYDFRGAFKAGAKPDPHTKHWVDTFKKPNHPTFSDQSQYAKDRPDLAGSWQGDTYIPPQQRAEGGEVAAQPGLRERWGALQTGSIASGGGKPGKNPAPLMRKDIVDTLRRHGINDKEALSGWAEHTDVDSRATGGSVDYETGERNPTARYDPGDETTFGSRFGQWDQTSEGKSVPRDEEDVDTTIMAPGQKMIDPLGHRGTRLPSGPWFYTRGMAEGGSVEQDRWQSLPSSRNIEDRRGENLTIGQLVAGNQAFMGHYPSPYTRAPRKPATAEARQTGGLVKSVLRRLTPEARMLEASRGEAPIRGLPQKPLDVGGEKFIPGPSADVREAARQYMQEKGLPYTPVQNYVPVDEPRARAIARAYDVMPHRPTDPEVRRSYEALAKETRDQYELLNKRMGVKFEPLPPNVPDPYGATPRLAAKDFLENKHMYYFPTEQGFGSEASGIVAKEGQKMLEPSGVKIGGKEVPFNDLFRVVHDVFGHHKEGVGFRAAGEENAWRSHGRMYSPEALPAMTAETRGQNSWVNYGPEAAKNKGASAAETIYAPQKLGILPPWVIRSGRMTPLGVAGAAAALEERDREPGEQGFKFADGGEVNEPPLPDAVMDAWERGALRTKRGVLGAETMEGRGRPGDKFVEDPGQKEEAAKRIFETVVPQSPLEWGLLAATGPFRWPIKAGGLALGAMMEPSEAEAGKLGAGRKIVSKITGAEVPAAGRSVTRSHNMPPEELAPYPHYAEEYPAVGPPVLKPKTKPKYPGETYEAKQLTPEAEAFAKERLRIQKGMDEKGYQPYFDPAKRTHVDPSNYPAANVDTLTVQPKKSQTLMEYQDVINMPATRELLRAAYERGLDLGDAKNWYAMAQLEEAYTKELGPKAGRKAFLDEFAVPMSAMTSGNDPETNFLLAQYAEHLRKQGKALPEEGHQLPVTVGGRRGAVNIRDYNAMRERGGYQGLGADQPKMHNFTRNIIGDPSRATMDEQMATGMTKHIQDVDPKFPDRARRQAFGILEKPVHEEAAAVGVPPANYQDVAWAGFKNEPGKPLISTINDAIERTHRLTGMPRDEIVRRGLIRKEIPIYGLTAAATPYLWGGFRPQEGGSNNPTPAGRLPL